MIKETLTRRPLSTSFSVSDLQNLPGKMMSRFHFVTCDFGKGVVSCPRFGDVAQLGERCLRKAEAGGSSPLISTIFFGKFKSEFG
jgi:hypothetical protein